MNAKKTNGIHAGSGQAVGDPLFTRTRDLPLLGAVRIVENGREIVRLDLGGKAPFAPLAGADARETPLLRAAFAQLCEYLAGARKTFDLPLNPSGTPFQHGVWQALRTIPYGQTRSYRQIAEAVNCPGGFRAVGMANNRNPIAVFIPCHRVIGASGSLVGYGAGLPLKALLLELESGL